MAIKINEADDQQYEQFNQSNSNLTLKNYFRLLTMKIHMYIIHRVMYKIMCISDPIDFTKLALPHILELIRLQIATKSNSSIKIKVTKINVIIFYKYKHN